jgi:undecaprenyl-phosphate galactose phosphotransferase
VAKIDDIDTKDKEITYDFTYSKVNDLIVYKREGKLLRKFWHYSYIIVKRILDIIIALVGQIILLPMIVIVKIINMINGDFAPVIFVQDRIGKDGKEFRFYKFRSMIPNADDALYKILDENPELAEEYRVNKKLKDDPRITKLGKFLRKTSLDELPQLWCILAGTMSVVGNRPYLPRERDDIADYYEDIIKTKPGLTGLWQVSGRSDTTFVERLELESYYSNNCNIIMDIILFFKTFHAVLHRKGAE